MYEVLFFVIVSIILISWFVIYIYTIFTSYEKEKEKELQEVLTQVKNNNVFQQLVTGNNIERVVIQGEISIDAIKKNLITAQNNIDAITSAANQANFNKQIQDIKIKSYELKINNDELNKQLLELQKDFDDIVFGTTIVSTRSLFPNSFRYHTKGTRSRNKELLYYLYKNNKDSFNIISGN